MSPPLTPPTTAPIAAPFQAPSPPPRMPPMAAPVAAPAPVPYTAPLVVRPRSCHQAQPEESVAVSTIATAAFRVLALMNVMIMSSPPAAANTAAHHKVTRPRVALGPRLRLPRDRLRYKRRQTERRMPAARVASAPRRWFARCAVHAPSSPVESRSSDAIFYGWWIVATAFVCHAVNVGLIFYSWGVFLAPLSEHFGSRGAVALAYSLMQTASAAIGLAVGRLVDRHGARPVQLVGA